jgi:hypothetical protein
VNRRLVGSGSLLSLNREGAAFLAMALRGFKAALIIRVCFRMGREQFCAPVLGQAGKELVSYFLFLFSFSGDWGIGRRTSLAVCRALLGWADVEGPPYIRKLESAGENRFFMVF